MKILAMDTSSSNGVLALQELSSPTANESAGKDFRWTDSARARHGAVLLPQMEQMLAELGWTMESLDLIAVGLGPGSFTGLRVGLATAKGLAFALSKPLVGVSTLRCVAASAEPSTTLCVPVLEAYRGEVYAAAYDRRDGCDLDVELKEVLPPFHGTPVEVVERVQQSFPQKTPSWVGSALQGHLALFSGADAKAARSGPDARVLARLGLLDFEHRGADDLELLSPVYLRGADAKLPARALTVE